MTIAVTVQDDGTTIAARIVEYVDKAAAVAEAVAAAVDQAESYADTLFESVPAGATLAPARVVATSNYAGAYPFTSLPGIVDDVTLLTGDRLLLTAQTAASRNGVWIVSTGAWTRPADYTGAIPAGKTIEVLAGTVNALTAWEVTGDGTIDTDVTVWTQLHDTLLTKETAAGVFAAVADPFFAAFGSGLAVFEDFRRPDIANFTQASEGYALKSGQALHADGTVASGSVLSVSGNRGVWTDGTPGATPIRIAGVTLNREPVMIGTRVNFSEETTAGVGPVLAGGTGGVGANAVMGTAAVSFALGSVQVGLWRTGLAVFVTENPLSIPYPVPLTVEFDRTAADNDETGYAVFAWFDRAASTLTVFVPGLMDAPQSVTDPLLAQYWGKVFCWQERRQATTDARIAFTGIGASFDAPNDSGMPASLTLPYQQSTYIVATPPDGYAPTDPQVDLFGAPTGGWNNGVHTNTIAALWNANASNRCFAPVVLSNGKPAAYLSADGTTTTGPVTCSTALPVNATGCRIRYDHTTAKVLFYSTTDPATTTTPTWTELGTAGGTASGLTAGTLLHAPPRRTPLQVGTRDNSSALMYGGVLSRVTWTDGGTVIGDCDLRTMWLDTKRRDTAGLTWYLTGTGWAWTPPSATSYITSKGDLIVGTGAGAAVRLPAGADGQTLVADSTQPTGLRYTAVSSLALATMPINQAPITAVGDTTFWTIATIATSGFTSGSVFRFKITGKLSMTSGAGAGASVRCKVAGTTLVSPISTSAPTSTYSDKLVTCLFDVWVDQDGSSGLVSADGAGDGLNASGALSRADVSVESAARDLSGGLAFVFSINLPAGSSFTPLRGIPEQVK